MGNPALNTRSDSDCHLTFVGRLHDAQNPQLSLSLVTGWLSRLWKSVTSRLLNLELEHSVTEGRERESGSVGLGVQLPLLRQAICGPLVPNCGVLRVCEWGCHPDCGRGSSGSRWVCWRRRGFGGRMWDEFFRLGNSLGMSMRKKMRRPRWVGCCGVEVTASWNGRKEGLQKAVTFGRVNCYSSGLVGALEERGEGLTVHLMQPGVTSFSEVLPRSGWECLCLDHLTWFLEDPPWKWVAPFLGFRPRTV